MIVFPNAKINIGLNVVSRRSDGYHNLETIFYPVQLSDALEMVPSEETALSLSGISIDGDNADNLVLKAYQMLQADFDLPPLHFHLHKIIPAGAGLGGGSSDAAFALRMMNDYFQLHLSSETLIKYAANLGADCAFFIQNKAAFATGTGNQLHDIEIDISEYEIIIAKPHLSVSTPEAYAGIIPKAPEFDLEELKSIPVENWKEVVVNDFERNVFQKYPEIKKIKEDMYQMGALFASMSGSGSAVFGIFRHSPTNPEKFLPRGIFIYR
ncbi:MAG TPA: 4-(cytidine 5'-diphospho)-2-C-methyl-D-erythritol kinase [Draconibacterium sp.]|nr:4-(cytidine 5'-diphospho)-2-C-methyl-D-erythritol kinase [Draconibacterium sp.]